MPALDPAEPPPSYEQVTGSSSTSAPASAHHNTSSRPQSSAHGSERPLPRGWLKQLDPKYKEYFYVDTSSEPPRSIWHHPYDDEEYLNTLPSEERERIQDEAMRREDLGDAKRANGDSKQQGVFAKHGDASAAPVSPATPTSPSFADSAAGASSSAAAAQGKGKGKKPLGERFKDKMTGMTHEQRVADREQRYREEEQYHRARIHFQNAAMRAYETGLPQHVGKDEQGRDVYVEPPGGPGSGFRRNPGAAHGNPYTQGPYADPNARFIRQSGPYGRPGYGGMGLPIAGGLAGGLLLGGLLF